MGRIGKPQKSNKHKKIKKTFDAEKAFEGDFTFGIGRNKMQNLPVKDEDLDRQDIPRKLRDIIQSKNKSPHVKGKKKSKQKKKLIRAADSTLRNEGAKKKLKPDPNLVQGKARKGSTFVEYVENEASKVLSQMPEEKKHKSVFDSFDLDPTMQDIYKKKSGERKKQKSRERKKKKQEIKKEKKRERAGDFSSFRDDVAFGEVAMAPPSLTAKPRKASNDNNEKPRPGKRSLLLKDMMNSTTNGETKNSTHASDSVIRHPPKTQAQRLAGQTIKRKYLSPVQKQITDFQRQNAIFLYRKMKDSKQMTS